jgi:tRNA(Phe) wybutosine-synthesizing methylase Tyw3
LKLISDTEVELQTQLQTFKTSSKDVNTEFGCDNCANFVPQKRQISSFAKFNILHHVNREIQGFKQGKNLSSSKGFRKVNVYNIKNERNIEVEIHQEIIGN